MGRPAERVGLLRGTGHDLGPYVQRYPRAQRSVLRLLRDQAQDRGDHPWLVFDGTDALTFADAHRLANRVGSAVGATVGQGAHVGLFLRNQPEFFPAMYGAMTAGGVAVPLNADARGPLLEHVVAQSEVRLLVARSDLLERLGDLESLHDVELVVAVGADAPERVKDVPVVGWDAWLAGQPEGPPATLPAHDATALLQFTSGTTGYPKGAIYSHHFLYLYAGAIADSLEHGPDDVLMTPLPTFHVAALHIIAHSALHAGCTAHLKSRFSASRFWEQAAEDGATFAIILGPMAVMVLKAVAEAPPHRLSRIFIVPPIEREEFERRYGVTVLWQGYGMTEVFPMPMRKEMLQGVPDDTLGYTSTWLDFGVVDEDDNLLGPGEVGELVFRPLLPYGMVSGYYKDPEATVHAFRNFMFHTGDLGTYDEDGLVHYRGRRQERIRRRGENVSALEVEFVALRHPAVVECACYGVPSPLGEEDVKLDVVLREDVDLADLHDWLRRNLPRYAVPRFLERRQEFQKTPSERVEKYKLKDLPLDRPAVFDSEAPDAR